MKKKKNVKKEVIVFDSSRRPYRLETSVMIDGIAGFVVTRHDLREGLIDLISGMNDVRIRGYAVTDDKEWFLQYTKNGNYLSIGCRTFRSKKSIDKILQWAGV